MDENTRTQLEMIAAQAHAISEALARTKVEALPQADQTHHEVSRLTQQAQGLIGDPNMAELLPQRVGPAFLGGTVAKSAVMAAAQRLAAALETLLAREPGRVEQLEREKQALEAKVVEVEVRAVTIKDDELRERCVDLLLRSGKADTAVGAACTVLEDRLRSIAGLGPDAYGVNLVDRALKRQNGILVLSDVDAEQEGAHHLYRGVVGFFKNPTSHRVIEDYDLTRARQVVGLIDTLLQLLREAKRRTDQNVAP